jgi:hypothetical protein
MTKKPMTIAQEYRQMQSMLNDDIEPAITVSETITRRIDYKVTARVHDTCVNLLVAAIQNLRDIGRLSHIELQIEEVRDGK